MLSKQLPASCSQWHGRGSHCRAFVDFEPDGARVTTEYFFFYFVMLSVVVFLFLFPGQIFCAYYCALLCSSFPVNTSTLSCVSVQCAMPRSSKDRGVEVRVQVDAWAFSKGNISQTNVATLSYFKV